MISTLHKQILPRIIAPFYHHKKHRDGRFRRIPISVLIEVGLDAVCSRVPDSNRKAS